MDELIEKYLDKIAYATGYDISDENGKNMLKDILQAGIQDMQDSGVSQATLLNNPLVYTTLVIFVMDNLNMSSGQITISSMYITNVSKLRWRSTDES